MKMALNCCKDLHCSDPSAGGALGIPNGFELGFCSLESLHRPVPVPDSALCHLTANVCRKLDGFEPGPRVRLGQGMNRYLTLRYFGEIEAMHSVRTGAMPLSILVCD
jgi:hypothetical protein